jgi:hypothetical protein
MQAPLKSKTKLRIDWYLSKVMVENTSRDKDLMRAYLAYAIHARQRWHITKEEFRAHLILWGHSPRQVTRIMSAFFREHTINGETFRFAEIVTAKSGRKVIVRLGLAELQAILGITEHVFAELPVIEASDVKRFNDALFILVAYGGNPSDTGNGGAGTTISRAAIKKLTGKAKSTQTRIEKRRNVQKRANYTDPLFPADKSTNERDTYWAYGKRVHYVTGSVQDSFPLVQIRNTFWSPFQAKLLDGYKAGLDTVSSKSAPRLVPEHGERYARQVYGLNTPLDLDIIKAKLERGLDIDIYVQQIIGCGKRVVGYFHRLLGGCYYSTEDLLTAVGNIARLRYESKILGGTVDWRTGALV